MVTEAMSILSVDLASRRYRDLGIAAIKLNQRGVICHFVSPQNSALQGAPSAQILASFLKGIAEETNSSVIFIDGPQGWKDPANGLEHCRVCERQCSTPGKTGVPGSVKPASWTYMAEFSIELFDQLDALGFSRLEDATDLRTGKPVALESFPTSAWKALGLKPLPGKSSRSPIDIRNGLRSLTELVPIAVGSQPTHDELQALVAALAGLPLLGFPGIDYSLAGVAPVQIQGTWREGFIVNPTRQPRG